MTARALAPILLASFFSTCNVGPKFRAPDTKVDARFGNSGRAGYSGEAAIADWWRKFNDGQLNRLIERALAGNHDLQIAAARVDEAKAYRTSVRLDYFPSVRSGAGYVNEKRSPASTGGFGFNFEPKTVEIYSAGFDATWELDLWGRVRRLNRAAKADVATAEAARHDTMVSLTAEVARAYLELRGLQNQLAVAQRNSENQRESLRKYEARLQGGKGTELDTSRARAQLNTTLAAIPLIEGAITKTIHRISVLLGEQPTVLRKELDPPRAMPALPSVVHIGNPAQLLRRRPDIEAAERSLESSVERVGVAVADLFPRVTFNGSVAIEANKLTGPGGSTHSFGPSLSWAAFDLGRVKAQIDAAGARARANLAGYQKTVLLALEETEDALVDYGRQRSRREYLGEAAHAAEQAAKLAQARREIDDPLIVLEAERTMLIAQSELAASQTNTATALVAIYKALGGGWQGR